jgi:hypothetical protein
MGSVNNLAELNREKSAKIIVDAIMVRVFIHHMERYFDPINTHKTRVLLLRSCHTQEAHFLCEAAHKHDVRKPETVGGRLAEKCLSVSVEKEQDERRTVYRVSLQPIHREITPCEKGLDVSLSPRLDVEG